MALYSASARSRNSSSLIASFYKRLWGHNASCLHSSRISALRRFRDAKSLRGAVLLDDDGRRDRRASGIRFAAGGLLNALQEGKDAFDTLEKVTNLVRQIERGEQPKVSGTPFSDLADKYDRAAKDITTSVTTVTAFDEAPYRVTVADLQDCSRRTSVRTRMSGYASALDKTAVNAAGAIADYDDALKLVAQAGQNMTYLISVNGKLSGVPIYGSTFLWNWFELETSVRKSLGTFESAVKSARTSMTKQRDVVIQKAANYKANLASLPDKCTLAGNWEGAMTASDGRSSPISLTIFIDSGQLAAGIFLAPHIGNPSDGFLAESFSANENGSVVLVTGGNQSMTLKGTASPTYDTISGTFTSAPANGSWVLRRVP